MPISSAYKGNIRDWLKPTILGVGVSFPNACIDFPREYTLWYGMLARCYSETVLRKFPTYRNVVVCDRWYHLANFIEDLPSLPGYERWSNKEDVDLDKDFLSEKENKRYSPETCWFIDAVVNIANADHDMQMKAVVHLETGIRYKSVNEASKKTGVSTSIIHHHSSGRVNSPQWICADPNKIPAEYTKRVVLRKVRCKNTGRIFDSLQDTAKHFNVSSSTIWLHCKEKTKEPKWEYVMFDHLKQQVIK